MSQQEIITLLENRKKPLSCADLVRLSGSNASSVSRCLNCLLKDNTITFVEITKKIKKHNIRYYKLKGGEK